MNRDQNTDNWDGVAKTFHWLLALWIGVQIPLGFFATRVRDEIYATGNFSQLENMIMLFNWHKSFGLSIAALMAVRLIWRLTRGRPPLTAMPFAMRMGAAATHWSLYLAVFMLFASGFLLNEAIEHKIDFFYLFEIPIFLDISEATEDLATLAHKIMAWSLLGFLALHIGAALFHHFVLKDDTLIRMLPGHDRGPKPGRGGE